MQVDLWYVRFDDASEPSWSAPLRRLLDEGERRHDARLRLPRVRNQHLVTRILVRSVLAAYTGNAPESFRFVAGPHGKPRLAEPNDCRWHFNVSHANGAVVCAIAEQAELGVDIERSDRRVNLDLAERYFAPVEVAQLRAQPEPRQPHRFLEFWTLKEAFIKSLGTGLATPLSHFAFHLDGPAPRLELFDAGLGQPEQWLVRQFDLEQEFLGAVAVRHPADTELELQIRAGLPE